MHAQGPSFSQEVVFMKKLFSLYCFRLSGLTRSEKTDIANEIKLSLLYLNLPSKWKQKSSHDVWMYVRVCVCEWIEDESR